MIPHIDLLISPWFEIRITWSLHCWIALIKDCLSYTNHHVPFVVIDKLFSKISESTKHWDTFATHCIVLHLPSHLGVNWCNENAAEDLLKVELGLREGQLNDSLHHIRIALGHKSYLFRNDICPACTQRLKTRAWAEVHAVEATVQHHARVYTLARKAIVDLGADSVLLDRYKVLTLQDLSVKTSVIAPQVRGQWNKSLPWFWTMDVRRYTDIGGWMEDCMCSFI